MKNLSLLIGLAAMFTACGEAKVDEVCSCSDADLNAACEILYDACVEDPEGYDSTSACLDDVQTVSDAACDVISGDTGS